MQRRPRTTLARANQSSANQSSSTSSDPSITTIYSEITSLEEQWTENQVIRFLSSHNTRFKTLTLLLDQLRKSYEEQSKWYKLMLQKVFKDVLPDLQRRSGDCRRRLFAETDMYIVPNTSLIQPLPISVQTIERWQTQFIERAQVFQWLYAQLEGPIARTLKAYEEWFVNLATHASARGADLILSVPRNDDVLLRRPRDYAVWWITLGERLTTTVTDQKAFDAINTYSDNVTYYIDRTITPSPLLSKDCLINNLFPKWCEALQVISAAAHLENIYKIQPLFNRKFQNYAVCMLKQYRREQLRQARARDSAKRPPPRAQIIYVSDARVSRACATFYGVTIQQITEFRDRLITRAQTIEGLCPNPVETRGDVIQSQMETPQTLNAVNWLINRAVQFVQDGGTMKNIALNNIIYPFLPQLLPVLAAIKRVILTNDCDALIAPHFNQIVVDAQVTIFSIFYPPELERPEEFENVAAFNICRIRPLDGLLYSRNLAESTPVENGIDRDTSLWNYFHYASTFVETQLKVLSEQRREAGVCQQLQQGQRRQQQLAQPLQNLINPFNCPRPAGGRGGGRPN